ncbi:inosine/xanthosine triphosphatase [Deinococcus koreensis]|uniref:Probable inosine/xanthosine triphosphatase n=1 Tax=Deinococcus koreensis TaxID=2054903 RepID=A0A2K3V1C5_9DEIO|nr:inosine/xanthosine triphosphatase [Deinococcus koreensis]PNY82578.1 inosine/xanthosine triphosphatase [Deinococcus koreensis]
MSAIVGSTSPAKVRAVQAVFGTLWPGLPVRGIDARSGVPEQPIGVAQTRRGAVNRARAALREPGATWALGLEGGVRFSSRGEAWLFGVVAVAQAQNQIQAPVQGGGTLHHTRSAELRLPAQVAARIRAGEELGPLMDELLGTVEIKKGVGTVGAFTRGLVTRPQVWQQTVALALAPLLTPELYRSAEPPS